MRPKRACRPFTPEENKQIETLFDEGKTAREFLEDKFGVSLSDLEKQK